MKIQTYLSALTVLGLASCSPEVDAESGLAEQATAELSSTVDSLQADLLVTGHWLADRLDDTDVVVLHVGADRAAYEAGHIPGARFLPIGAITIQRGGIDNELPTVAALDSVFESVGVPDEGRIVIYGPPLQAARAFFTLDYLGHGDRSALLDGGLEHWRDAGRPVSAEPPPAAESSFRPRVESDRLVDADWVSRHLEDPGVVLLDARPADQYTGAEAGDGVPRPGHIPGAVNIFWEEMIRSGQQPSLKEPAALRTRFEEAGVQPGDTVVTYCRTGMQASFAYFVARYLGYETRMYDGSFMDWSQRTELPVER